MRSRRKDYMMGESLIIHAQSSMLWVCDKGFVI